MATKKKRKLKPLPVCGLAFTTAKNIANFLRCMADDLDMKYDQFPYYQMELYVNKMDPEDVDRFTPRGEMRKSQFPAKNNCGCTWIYPPDDNLEYHI